MKEQKKTKILVAVSIVLILVLAVFAFVYSNNKSRFVVAVEQNSADSEDDNLRISEKILMPQGQNYYDLYNLDYQVKLKNLQGANRNLQVAMVVDTSYSMQLNDEQSIVKQTATSLVSKIKDEVENASMSVSGNGGVKLGMTSVTSNETNIKNTINGLTMEEVQDCNNGLQAAYSTFGTASNISKVLIYFTDSTDNITEKMQTIMEQDPQLKVISVLIDMTSSSYLNLNNGNPIEYTLTTGKKYQEKFMLLQVMY